MSKSDTKQRIELKLHYYLEDFTKIWAGDIAIREHIENGTDIPSDILKELYGVFERPMLDDISAREQLIQNAAENILHLAKELKYDFNIKVKYPKKKKTAIPSWNQEPYYGKETKNHADYTIRAYTLKDFLQNFFSRISASDKLPMILSDKHKFIAEAYKMLLDYMRMIPKRQQPKSYAQTIIIGILAVNFGLLSTKEQHKLSPSYVHYTEYLHNSTKYICKKINR